MARLNKKQSQHLDLSIMLADYKEFYVHTGGEKNNKFSVFNRKNNDAICPFGTFSEISYFIKGLIKGLKEH